MQKSFKLVIVLIISFFIFSCAKRESKKEYAGEEKTERKDKYLKDEEVVEATEETAEQEKSEEQNIYGIPSNEIKRFDFGPRTHDYYKIFTTEDNLKQDSINLLFTLDPEGKTHQVIKKYKNIALNYGITIIALPGVRNGLNYQVVFNHYEAVLRSIKSRIKKPFKIGLIGFSGGGRYAGMLKNKYPNIEYIISICAGTPTTLDDKNPAFHITTTEDFNYLEVLRIKNQFIHAQTDRNFIFPGTHDWVAEKYLQPIFEYKFSDNRYTTNVIKLINDTKETHLKIAYSQLIPYNQRNKIIDPSLQQTLAQYHKNLLKAQQEESFESQKQTQILASNLDTIFWIQNVAQIQRTKFSDTCVSKRILNTLSITCYTQARNAISKKEHPKALKWSRIYKIVDNDNSTAWYFNSIENIRLGNNTQAERDFKEYLNLAPEDYKEKIQDPIFSFIVQKDWFVNKIAELNRAN